MEHISQGPGNVANVKMWVGLRLGIRSGLLIRFIINCYNRVPVFLSKYFQVKSIFFQIFWC